MKHSQFFAAGCLVALWGCAGQTPTSLDAFAAAETSLLAADQAALAYFSLQPCSATSTVICKSPPVESLIKVAAKKAYDALAAARPIVLANPSGSTAEVTAMAAVQAALAAYGAALPQGASR